MDEHIIHILKLIEGKSFNVSVNLKRITLVIDEINLTRIITLIEYCNKNNLAMNTKSESDIVIVIYKRP